MRSRDHAWGRVGKYRVSPKQDDPRKNVGGGHGGNGKHHWPGGQQCFVLM